MVMMRFLIKKIIKQMLFLLRKNDDFREYHHFPFDTNKPLPPNADNVMRLCCELLESLAIKYRLTDGTILGLYRQGSFIPHDTDIDVDVLDFYNIEKLHTSMKKQSMKLGRKAIYKKKVQQLVYYSNDNVIFDIVFWYSEEGDMICNYSERGYKRVQNRKYFENLSTIGFNGKKYPMPCHIEEWLEMRYGKDWRTPKSFKNDWKAECGDLVKMR